MDATHLPAIIGTCPFCLQPLYADAPVAAPLAHVGCAVDARRR